MHYPFNILKCKLFSAWLNIKTSESDCIVRIIAIVIAYSIMLLQCNDTKIMMESVLFSVIKMQ